MKVELAKGVYWVGVIDWNIRVCGSYNVPLGTTYNAYLIVDEKIALVDTVKTGFHREMLQRIREIIDPKKIDYLIVNHVEMDHAGALPEVIKEAQNAEIIVAKRGEEGFLRHYGEVKPLTKVKTGDTLSLGKKNLAFIEASMLHWPDNMMTYLKEDGILFSNDPFGQHIATSERYADEVKEAMLMEQAARYYAAIVMPYSPVVLKKLEEIKKSGINIKIIAPSHGLIWRKEPEKILQAYEEWAKGEGKNKALIVYDTMWHGTEKMAMGLSEGVATEGVSVKVYNLRNSDWTKIAKEAMEAKAIFVGSPTLNNGMYPTVAGFLHYLKGLRPQNKLWITFGCYGWGGGAVKAMKEELEKGRFEVVESLEIKYSPDEKEISECIELGKRIAKKIKG